jgi:hypothetical protein
LPCCHRRDSVDVPVGVFHPHEGEWIFGPLINNNSRITSSVNLSSAL